VTRSVCLSVCLLVTLVSPAKTAKPIEMPFRVLTLVGQMNYILHRGTDPPTGGGTFEGKHSNSELRNNG